MLCAVPCHFMRTEGAKVENGVAITSVPGLSDVLIIFPEDGKSKEDVLEDVYDYHLLWANGTFPIIFV